MFSLKTKLKEKRKTLRVHTVLHSELYVCFSRSRSCDLKPLTESPVGLPGLQSADSPETIAFILLTNFKDVLSSDSFKTRTKRVRCLIT